METSPETPVVVDIRKSIYQALGEHWQSITLAVLLSLLWSAGVIIFCELADIGLDSDFTFIVIAAPWIYLLYRYSKLAEKIRAKFWQQLANKYSWVYTASKNILAEKALIFTIGHSSRAKNSIAGEYHNQPFSIFEYQYTVGHGKHAHTYLFTVFEIKFNGTFPHLYLNHLTNDYSLPLGKRFFNTKLSLPAQFEKQFTLYAPKEYEIEALEVFSLETLDTLLKAGWNHDLEFIDGELIIYSNKQVNNINELETEIQKIQGFVDHLAPRLNRLKLSQIGNLSPLLKA